VDVVSCSLPATAEYFADVVVILLIYFVWCCWVLSFEFINNFVIPADTSRCCCTQHCWSHLLHVGFQSAL